MTSAAYATLLRQSREGLGATPTEVAAWCGVTADTYLDWEAGTVVPALEQLAALEGALDLPAGSRPEPELAARSRQAGLLHSALISAGFADSDLAALCNVDPAIAQLWLEGIPIQSDQIEEIADAVDTEAGSLREAVRTDLADARLHPGPTVAEAAVGHLYARGNLLSADAVRIDAGLRCRWRCLNWPTHTWVAAPAVVVGSPSCPHCTADRPECVANQHPELVTEWSVQNDIAPTDVTGGHSDRLLWNCPEGHEWSATIAARLAGSTCPICDSVYVAGAHLVADWHPDNRRSSSRVRFDSTHPVLWKCRQRPRHVWAASPAARSADPRCPHCEGAIREVTVTVADYPHLVSEWAEPHRTPQDVLASSSDRVQWRCSAGHTWTAAVAARTLTSAGCAVCDSGWSLEALQDLASSIAGDASSLTPAELFLLFQQSGCDLDTPEVGGLLEAVSIGALTTWDLEEFASGRPSKVDDLLNSPDHNLRSDGPPELHMLQIPTVVGDRGLVDDPDAAEFLVRSATARILQRAYDDLPGAHAAVAELPASAFGLRVRSAVERTLGEADALPIPDGWAFTPGGTPTSPNLMQRVVACRVRDERRLGNWSGTGAGKTVSALLASRVVDAKTTLILCPNAVVDTWVTAIGDVFPGSGVSVKNLRQRPFGEHVYLVANYEHVQRPEAPAELEVLAAAGIDLVVIDEIHQAKQRDPHTQSLRRENLERFLAAAAIRNPGLRVLGMSATPVINNLTEGVSLVDLVTGAASGVGTDPTISNCMALHQQLVRRGIRWMPAYDIDLNYQEVPVELDEEAVAELLALPRTAGPLAVEQILTAARLPAILNAVRPKTLLYTHYKTGIVDQLTAALEEAGWSVGHYTGDDKTGMAGFVHGDIDVLIGTSSIGTGVDGLQHVCSRAIVNVLPWTDADYTQLKGRIFRQGQHASRVDFVVPVTHAGIAGEEWSWCRMKLDRLTYKRSVADAAVEGTIPERFQLTPDQAAVHSLAWLARLAGGG